MPISRRGFLAAAAISMFVRPAIAGPGSDDSLDALARFPAALGRASPWAPVASDSGVAQIVDALYRGAGISGDAATTDFSLFDLGQLASGQARGAKAGTAPLLAIREARGARMTVTLAIFASDGVGPGVWRLGPAVGSDLVIVRPPALTPSASGSLPADPLAPALPAPFFAVLDIQGETPRFWTEAAAGVFLPLGTARLDPDQGAPLDAEDSATAIDLASRAGAPISPGGDLPFGGQVRRLRSSAPGGADVIAILPGSSAQGRFWLTKAGVFATRGESLVDRDGFVYDLQPNSGAAFPARRWVV